MKDDFIPYGRQYIDEEDVAMVAEVLRGDFLTTGPWVARFEDTIAEFTGAKFGIAVSSGTAALHAACHAAGFGPGDEVIVPANTFAATANAVLYTGARPVFADIEPGTWNIDPEDVSRKINKNTRGIIPVHFSGQPADMDEMWEIAKKNNLIVIEDACHALGSAYEGKPVGGLSQMTVFSFHPVKHITTAEGGMITTNDPELASRLKSFRSHGIEKPPGTWFYEQLELGFNYRLTDIQAALGISQLNKLRSFIDRRAGLAARYNTLLADTEIGMPVVKPGRTSAWHIYVVQVRNREKVYKMMTKRGIGVNVHYIPVYWHPYYHGLGYKKGICPVSEKYYEHALTIPLYFGLSEEQQDRVVNELKSANL